jgi:hypothetical protein
VICSSVFFLINFCISKAGGTAQFLTPFFHFRQRYRGDLLFALLSVKAIKVATFCAAKLCLYCSL